jgi:hypothetical protein
LAAAHAVVVAAAAGSAGALIRIQLLKQELLTCQQSETPQHKETSMHVLSSMFDNMRPIMLPHLAAIVQILSANLSHAHTLVRRGALQAIQIVFAIAPRALTPVPPGNSNHRHEGRRRRSAARCASHPHRALRRAAGALSFLPLSDTLSSSLSSSRLLAMKMPAASRST